MKQSSILCEGSAGKSSKVVPRQETCTTFSFHMIIHKFYPRQPSSTRPGQKINAFLLGGHFSDCAVSVSRANDITIAARNKFTTSQVGKRERERDRGPAAGGRPHENPAKAEVFASV